MRTVPCLESPRTALLLFSLAFMTFPSASAGNPQSAGSDGAETLRPKPTFKRESYDEQFVEAVKLFDMKDYRKAAAAFKKVARGAATDEDREKVLSWYKGSMGGLYLTRLYHQARTGNQKDAYFQTLDYKKEFQGTPVIPVYESFLADLEPKVIEPIEDFDTPSSKYTKKYGKEWTGDAALAFNGRGCMRWHQTPDKKGFQILVGDVPKNWTAYDGIVFWIKPKTLADIEIIVRSPGKVKAQQNVHAVTYKPKKTGQWIRVYHGFQDFQKYGEGSFSSVSSFLLQTSRTKNFEFLVDHICLVRKDSAGAAPAGGGR